MYRHLRPALRATTPICLAVASLTCGGGTEPNGGGSTPTTVTIATPPATTVFIGDTLTLTATVRDQAGDLLTGMALVWSSLDPGIVKVTASDSGGLVAGPGAGNGRLVARVQAGPADTIIVVVVAPPVIVLAPSAVQFADSVGGTGASGQAVTVTNGGGSTLTGLGVGAISYGTGATGWLSAQLNGVTAPTTLTLQASTGVLAVGTYSATFPVTSTGRASPQTVAVTLTVTPGNQAATVDITAPGAPLSVGDTLTLLATVRDSAGAPMPGQQLTWSSLDPTTVTVTAPDSGGIVGGPQPGNGRVVAQVPGGPADTVTVVVVALPFIVLTPDSVQFADTVGGTGSPGQVVAITNGGAGVVGGLSVGTITYGSGATGWLTAQLSGAAAPATLTLQATTGTLAAGSYSASVPISSSGQAGPQTVFARFTITPAPVAATVNITGPTAPLLVGDTLTLMAVVLDSTGTPMPGAPLTWTSLNPNIIKVTAADSGGIVAGPLTGNGRVVARVTGGPADTVTVTVMSRPSIVLTPASVLFADTVFGVGAPSRAVAVTNGGGGVLSGLAVGSIAYGAGATGWLSAQLSGSAGPATLTLQATTGDITAGSYNAIVPITATAPVAPESVSVILTITTGRVIASVTIVSTPGGLMVDDTLTLFAAVRDSAGQLIFGAPLEWSSLDPGIVTVTNPDSGRILAGPGTGFGRVVAGVASGPADTLTLNVFPRMPIAVQRIGAGGFHNCYLNSIGAAYCWGKNNRGQLGDFTGTDQSTPVAVAGNLTFASLTLGREHTCGLTTDGTAYCWGYNNWGQLGDNTVGTSFSPVAVSGGLTFVSLSAGGEHTCGVTSAGAAYCWGSDRFEELGDGNTGFLGQRTPVPVLGGLTFAAISAGNAHSCGLTPSGAAYCWGRNFYGELGDGTTTSRPAPVAVAGGLTFASVGTGEVYSCGMTTAGAVYCWGRNEYGKLGDGGTADRNTPGLVTGGLTFTALTVAADHVCGLVSSGAAYCWGANISAQLGEGSTVDRYQPTPVTGGLTFVAVSAGELATCGMTDQGAAFCWGDNTWGELGNGLGPVKTTPSQVLGGLTFAELSTGSSHTCGVTVAGVGYCWGYNLEGELGDGTTADRATPTPISGGLSFTSVQGGILHTCGLATGGTIYCWGDGSLSQLGDGSTIARSIPGPVGGGLSFVGLTVGASHSCALTAAGAAYCWGFNGFGQLGDSSTSHRNQPVAVAGGLTFTTLVAGGRQTCGLTSTGSAYCWGDGSTGQLGDGSTTGRSIPGPVGGGLSFVELTAGGLYGQTCGLTAAGAAYCWGENDHGQLGDGTKTMRTSPVPVTGGLTFATLDTGGNLTCGITPAGAAYCWGAAPGLSSVIPVAVVGGLVFDLISGGHGFACGRTVGGMSYCWGARGYGALGDGTFAWSPFPVRVLGT